MAEKNVIQSLLDDLQHEQPIHNAVCVGQDLRQYDSIDWQHFSVNEMLNQPFQNRYDLGFVCLDTPDWQGVDDTQKTQVLVKLRDLWAKRLVVVCNLQDEQLMRSLGFTQLIDQTQHNADFALWQFNILTYKHVPDWFNAKFWANPENWDKYRW